MAQDQPFDDRALAALFQERDGEDPRMHTTLIAVLDAIKDLSREALVGLRNDARAYIAGDKKVAMNRNFYFLASQVHAAYTTGFEDGCKAEH